MMSTKSFWIKNHFTTGVVKVEIQLNIFSYYHKIVINVYKKYFYLFQLIALISNIQLLKPILCQNQLFL